jgi:hypothetical protein
MTWPRTLQLDPQKFLQVDKYMWSDIVLSQTKSSTRNFFILNFLIVEFYCGHFEPISHE